MPTPLRALIRRVFSRTEIAFNRPDLINDNDALLSSDGAAAPLHAGKASNATLTFV